MSAPRQDESLTTYSRQVPSRARALSGLAKHVVHSFPGFHVPGGEYMILLVSESSTTVLFVAAASTYATNMNGIRRNVLRNNIGT